jgi:hypothetical protein
MIHVIIYGLGTSQHETIKHRIKQILKDGEVPYLIHDETSIESFLMKELGSIPAVEVDGQLLENQGDKTNNEYLVDILNYLAEKIKTKKDEIHNRTN